MTQEEKQLLVKDLSARLPYGVKFATKYESHKNNIYELIAVNKHCETVETFGAIWWNIEDIKPYLRPMESMTEKEKNEFIRFTSISMHRFRCEATDTEHWFNTWEEEDYLDAHHFDYRRLIPMGLALPATDGMYDFK